MKNNNKQGKLGILFTLAQFYKERRPEVSAEFSEKWRNRVNNYLSDDFDLFFPNTAHSESDFRDSVTECEKENCDLLLIIPMAYTSSGAAKNALVSSKLPLLLVSTAWDYTLPVSMTGDYLFANQAIHGVQDITNVLRRAERAFSLVAGHLEEDKFRDTLKKACLAGRAASFFFKGKAGRIGGSLDGMLDFSYNLGDKQEHFGFKEIDFTAADLLNTIEKLKDGEVNTYLSWMKNNFEIDEGLSEEELRVNAEYSLALENIAHDNGLDSLSMNFSSLLDNEKGTLPFIGASKLISEGVGYGGEGDTLTALLNTALYQISPDSTFSEFFCPDYGKEEIILSHMGECNIGLANPHQSIKLKPREFPWGNMVRPAVPVFQMKPGKITLTSISENINKDKFQLLTLLGNVLEYPDHPNLQVPYTRINLEKNINQIIQDYSLAGGTHHIVLSYGDIRGEISTLAKLCGMQYFEL